MARMEAEQIISLTPMNTPSMHNPAASENNHALWRVLWDNHLVLYTIVCNPVLVLHLINGLLSLLHPDVIQYSMYHTSIQPHLDVHAHDGFCRLFTVIMVALQSALYSRHAPKIHFPLSADEYGDESDVDR